MGFVNQQLHHIFPSKRIQNHGMSTGDWLITAAETGGAPLQLLLGEAKLKTGDVPQEKIWSWKELVMGLSQVRWMVNFMVHLG